VSDLPVTAVIIPFPTRAARSTEDGQDRLRRALEGLDRALADQRSAIAAWRGAIGELNTVVSGLGGSLQRYHGSLDSLATRVDGLRAQAMQLECVADAALTLAAD
jgi:ABC-type transporter Mla subunit MlaD